MPHPEPECRRRWKTHPPLPVENAPLLRAVVEAAGGRLTLARFVLIELGRRVCLTWSAGPSFVESISLGGWGSRSWHGGMGSVATR